MNKTLEIIRETTAWLITCIVICLCNITAWLISLLIIVLLAWAGFAALERMQSQSGGVVSEGQP